MSELIDDYLNRAAPPGSMRYFALLYAPPELRDALSALFVIDNEIEASVRAAHEVAHTRMQWWRAEIDRLINRNAQHPATKLLQSSLSSADFSLLHERLTAADMDLARMSYNTASELQAYLNRSGGTVWRMTASDADATLATALGAWIRRVETLRDVAVDVRIGLVYWPLNELETGGITLEQLRDKQGSQHARALIKVTVERLLTDVDELLAQPLSNSLRPLKVLATLHRKLLQRVAASNYDVFTQRHELSPFAKTWTAWRAARASQT